MNLFDQLVAEAIKNHRTLAPLRPVVEKELLHHDILRELSSEEILADKILAFALRPNRLKNRDLWDVVWLRQQGIQLPNYLVPIKIADHHRTIEEFRKRLVERRQQLAGDPGLRSGFQAEMERFLPPDAISETVIKTEFWDYLVAEIEVECAGVLRVL